jgi:hypothetical protein
MAQLTKAQTFGELSGIENNLFEVRGGIPSYYAVNEALCLAQSIESLSREVQDEPSVPKSWMISFAANAIKGLLQSVESGLEKDESRQSCAAETIREEHV